MGLASDFIEELSLVSTSDGMSEAPAESSSAVGESDSSTATLIPVADIMWRANLCCKADPLWNCEKNLTEDGRGKRNLCEDIVCFVDFLVELYLVKQLFFFIVKAVTGMDEILLIEHGITGVIFNSTARLMV